MKTEKQQKKYDDLQAKLLKKIRKIQTMALVLNAMTDFCIMLEDKGHVKFMVIQICKDKESYYKPDVIMIINYGFIHQKWRIIDIKENIKQADSSIEALKYLAI